MGLAEADAREPRRACGRRCAVVTQSADIPRSKASPKSASAPTLRATRVHNLGPSRPCPLLGTSPLQNSPLPSRLKLAAPQVGTGPALELLVDTVTEVLLVVRQLVWEVGVGVSAIAIECVHILSDATQGPRRWSGHSARTIYRHAGPCMGKVLMWRRASPPPDAPRQQTVGKALVPQRRWHEALQADSERAAQDQKHRASWRVTRKQLWQIQLVKRHN